MEFRILGPVEVVDGARVVPLGPSKQRALLALLLLHVNEVVSRDRLIDDLWGERAPRTAATSLHTYVSQLRKVLEAGSGTEPRLLLTRTPGYLLALDPDQVDLKRFERLARRGQDELASSNVSAAATTLVEALSLWRGPPLAEFDSAPFALAESLRLQELRLCAVEDRIDSDLALGRHDHLVAEVDKLVGEHPYRERLCGQLMLALYRSGRQTEALEAYRKTRRRLVDELGIEPGPNLHELEQAILRHDPTIVSHDATGQAALHTFRARTGHQRLTNLPVSATPFLGREQELREVVELLERNDTRLLTLSGAGGIGKTRLALEAASRVKERFPDGVIWVALSPLRDPALLPAAAAEAIQVREEPHRSLLGTLVARLSSGRWLLLLDNLEHLLPDAAADVVRLQEAAGLTLLVTSRERLQLQGERIWPVPALAEEDSIALFHERARALSPSFEPSAADTELCARLDNMPLAIELAAARTPLFSTAQLLERLEQRLDLLKGARDADPRQRTLRATMEWSYELLTAVEQRLFRLLSVFAGGCTYEAAVDVCDASPDPLQSLLDKSLLQRRVEDPEPRYWMLETVRTYAAERRDTEEAEQVCDRHARFFAELVDAARRSLGGPNDMRVSRGLASDGANIVTAIRWAKDRDEAELLVRLAFAGEMLRGMPPAQQISWFEEAFKRSEHIDPVLLAHAKARVGGLMLILDHLKEARAALQASASLFEELDDAEGEAQALELLGAVLSEVGEPEAGRACLARAFALAERAGGQRSYKVVHTLGELEREHGNPDQAADYLLRSVNAARREGDFVTVANALHGLADVLLLQRDAAAAGRRYAEALQIFSELSGPWGSNSCLRGLAAVAALQHQVERAGCLWGAASAIERDSGVGVTARSYDRYRAAVTKVEGPEFDSAAAEGLQMTLAEAVAYAHTSAD
jgi:predicted ATPase/DNA-binding SARP family transcriptional activator